MDPDAPPHDDRARAAEAKIPADREGARGRLARLAFAVNVGAATLACGGWSCLPDVIKAEVSESDAGPPTGGPPASQAQCGDGVIDLDAGEQCDPGDGGIGCTSGEGGCKIDCPEGGLVDPTSNHCYFVATSTARQESANASCKDKGGHLVTFTSEEELQLVVANLAGWAATGGAWVGLSVNASAQAYASSALDEPGYPTLATKCEGCYAHAQDGGRDFPAVPLADGGRGARGSCVLATNKLAQPWFSVACDLGATNAVLQTVCEREPPGSTLHKCGLVDCVEAPSTVAKKRYLFVSDAVSGDAAQSECAALGGHLFTPDTRDERDQVARELAPLTSPSVPFDFWIGVSIDGSGTPRWDDVPGGTPLASSPRPLPWGDREPAPLGGPGRAFMRLSLGAYDTQLAHAALATQTLPYLCELPAGS